MIMKTLKNYITEASTDFPAKTLGKRKTELLVLHGTAVMMLHRNI